MGQISRFVIPDSVRISWSVRSGKDLLEILAVDTPEGNTVVVLLNTNNVSVAYKIQDQGQTATGEIPAHAIQTLVFETDL